MNSVAVRKLVDSKMFEDIYVPPDPGDGGAAAGAALLCLAKSSALEIKANDLPFVGLIRPNHVKRFSKLGLEPKHFRLEEEEILNDAELTEKIAALIEARKIVGWCQGRFESGPRALGARSILIRPDDIDLAKRLSHEVKARAAFRPYALSIIEADADRILENYVSHLRPYRWMQIVDKVRPEHISALKAGLHIDQTTRPQVVRQEDFPKYHLLLAAVQKRLGLGVLINTSFNESGYPIVNSSREALAVFLRSSMDVLVIENTIYRKKFTKEER